MQISIRLPNVVLLAICVCLNRTPHASAQEAWQPAKGPLTTKWATEIAADKTPLPEYPRPQMERNAWQNLNGLWDSAIRPRGDQQPSAFDGRIMVPFAVESALSGVMKPVGDANRLWYRRTFDVPRDWRQNAQRVLLHFGAIGWEATVSVNGKKLGVLRRGYDAFNVDVTDALKPDGPQELVVAVWDPTDYETVELPAAARKLLKPGKITIAVHCRQTTGGQFMDVGIVDVIERQR